jgi:hypothetical protein
LQIWQRVEYFLYRWQEKNKQQRRVTSSAMKATVCTIEKKKAYEDEAKLFAPQTTSCSSQMTSSASNHSQEECEAIQVKIKSGN